MKSACVGVLSIIELKNARWNIEIIISYLFLCIFKWKWAQLLCPHFKNFHQKKKKVIHLNLNSSSGLPEACEVTLEVVQAMTHDLRQQTLNLQEERERLVSARRELGKLQWELPQREKKTNTQVRGEECDLSQCSLLDVYQCSSVFQLFRELSAIDISLSFIYLFHWHVQNATIPCRSQELLPFLSVMYFFLPPFSTNYSSILCHLILPSISWNPLNLVVPKFIYNTLLGILFSSILCTCPN